MARIKDEGGEAVDELRAFGLRYPGAHTKSPWPGHLDLAVKDKTFAYLSIAGEPLTISCKLPRSAESALSLPFTTPTAYGLGKSGWVTATFPDGNPIPLELLREWIDESYRAQAPKRLSAGLPALGAAGDEPLSLASNEPTPPRPRRSSVNRAASRPARAAKRTAKPRSARSLPSSARTQPVAAKSAPAKSGPVRSAAAKSELSKPVVVKSGPTKSAAAKSRRASSAATKPEPSKRGTAKAGLSKGVTAKPEPAKSVAAKAPLSKRGAAKRGAAKPGLSKRSATTKPRAAAEPAMVRQTNGHGALARAPSNGASIRGDRPTKRAKNTNAKTSAASRPSARARATAH